MSNPIGTTYIHPARKLAALGVMLLLALTASLSLGVQSAYADEQQADVAQDGVSYHLWYADAGASVAVRGYTGTATQVALSDAVSYGGKSYSASGGTGFFFIEEKTFAGNTKITEIAIPDKYEAISSGAFTGCTNLKTILFKGDIVDEYSIEGAGIGTDSNGNPIAGVTVWTKEGSNVDKAIQELNKSRPEDKKISLKYDNDPYSKRTKPSDSGGSGSGGGGTTDQGGSSGSTDQGGTGGSGGSQAVTVTKGEDGTAFGKGASEKVAETAILNLKNDKDPKGTSFGLLQAKGTAVGKNKVKLTWKKAGAAKFVIYGNKCGVKNKYKYLKTTTKTSLTLKKVAGAKVKKGTYYKFIVVGIDAKGKVVSTSKTIHVATTGGKVGNDKKVNILKGKKAIKKLSLKKGKTATIKAKLTPQSKKLKVNRHRKASFESSNTSVATVNAKGKITAKGKGTCYIYAYAQNGVFAKVKVTVK